MTGIETVLTEINVYVADSSLFPSSCGANPSWTIMALSHRVASRLAAGQA